MSSPSPRKSIDSNRSPQTPRNGFPFPAFEAQVRQPSMTRQRTRRGSTASTLSAGSVGGSLDIQSRRGSAVRETSQNAISTLLQPPIVRTGLVPHTQASAAAAGFKAPTTKDIPPVTLTTIPHVPQETFRDYINRVGPLFESFQRGRAEAEQPQWMKRDEELERTDRFAQALERRVSGSVPSAATPPTISRQQSVVSLSPPPERPTFPKRRSSLGVRRNRNEPTPLSTIPNIYFEEDFHLENPRTFDVVSERAEIVRPPPGTESSDRKIRDGSPLPPRKALVTNAILQEKLSWYMDTVEIHLISSISSASNGFFAALGSLKELQSEAEESVAKIQRLREDLRRLDQEVALSGLEVAAKRRRKENVGKLRRATAQVQSVVENIQRADTLVDEGEYEQALNQMDKVGRLVCGNQESGGEHEELIDLRPLKALQGLDNGLQELQLRIGAGFAQRFTSILIEDIRRHVAKVDPSDTLKRWSKQRGIAPVYMEISEDFRRDLEISLKGLARAGHTAPATAAYREAVQKEMKILIKKHLPSSSDDDADSMVSTSTRGGTKLTQQEKSSILARNLRSLGAEDAETLTVKIYTSVGEALRRVSTQTKILLDVTSNMETPDPKSPRSPKVTSPDEVINNVVNGTTTKTVQEELSQSLDMSSLLGQAVDTAQTQITKILKVRNEQSIRLSKGYFLRYFNLNRLFADECEGVSGRGGTALKGVVNAQITGFVQVLGTAETERIANLLDSESWNAEDFSDKHNVILQRILGAMSSDPPEWTKGPGQLWDPAVGQQHTETTTNGHVTNGTSAPTNKTQAKPAYIDETRYILVPSVTSLLPTIDVFLSLTAALPSMTPQISASLLDVLRTFNSRSCQLILGAGATRSAGLKSITTKHLALASQALSFIVALVPYIRECVRRHVPAGQGNLLADFDKTKRLYQDHQAGIHDKLVEIMTSRSQAHVKALRNLDLDNNASDTAAISPYMDTLTKETLTLHRVLARHLSEIDVGLIMRQIASGYREQWTGAFAEAEPATAKGEARLLRDAEAFAAKLGKLEEFGEIGKEVLATVKAQVAVGEVVDEEEEEKKKEIKGEKGKMVEVENGGKEESQTAKTKVGGEAEKEEN